MARNRKRYDIYNQPGLFDLPSLDQLSKGSAWSEKGVVMRGGDYVAEPEGDGVLPPVEELESNAIRFISFGSGSSGNCSFIGNGKYGFLIDAGVDGEKIEKALLREGIDMFKVMGIILTHDHHDHVSHAYRILRNNRHMALFCTPRTLNGILRRHGTSGRIKEYHHPIYKEFQFTIKDFKIIPFEVSHDGSDNVGYMIDYRGNRFVVATDMGYIGERADYYMRQANSLMIESDYDAEMLRRGRYPEMLKARIVASKGHLDNAQVAEFLESAWTPELKHVFLCHLSNDNNTPAKAVKSAADALLRAGASSVGDASERIGQREAPVQVYALPRFDSSPFFFLQ